MIFKKLFSRFNGYVDIDAGFGFIIMAEHLFYVLYGYNGFEHLGCKCVPEYSRGHFLSDSDSIGMVADHVDKRGLTQCSYRAIGGMLIVGQSAKYQIGGQIYV